MDKKHSDAYVAELLQQLEELKRRKARKLQKLQRLGKRSTKQASASQQQPQSSSETSSTLKTSSQENKTDQPPPAVNCLQCGAVLITSDRYCNSCKTSDSNENRKKSDADKTLPLKPINLDNMLISPKQELTSVIKCTEKKEVDINAIAEVRVSAICDKTVCTIQEDCMDSVPNLSESCSNNASENLKQSIVMPEKVVKNEIGCDVKDNTDINCCEQFTLLTQRVLDRSDSTSSLPQTHGREDTKNHRKRSTSASEEMKENGKNGAKKMRVSEEFEQVLQNVEHNEDVTEGCVLIDSRIEDVFQENENNTCVKAPEAASCECDLILDENKKNDELPENGMDESMANMACFLSGSFTEEDENPKSEDTVVEVVVDKSAINSESLPVVLNKDDSGSEKVSNNSSISFSSAKFSSPFSDELTFPATAIEISSTKNSNSPVPDKGLDRTVPNTSQSPVQTLSTDSKEIHLPVETSDVTLKENLVSKYSDLYSETLEKPVSDTSYISKDIQLIHLNDQDEMDDNLTPSLLDSAPHLPFEVKEMSNKNNLKQVSKQFVFEQATVDISNDECPNAFNNNALIAELDSLSLVAVDAVEDTLLLPHKQQTASIRMDSDGFKVPSIPQIHCIEVSDTEILACDSELFTIPETEMLEPSFLKKAENKVPNLNISAQKEDANNLSVGKICVELSCEVSHNIASTSFSCSKSQEENHEDSKTLNEFYSLPKPKVLVENDDICDILDDSFSESLSNALEQYDVSQDSLMVEDTLELKNYRNIQLLKSEVNKDDNTLKISGPSEDDLSFIKFMYCMHSEIREPVSDVKIAFFNNSYYLFIQHTTWVQVWRLEDNDWTKLFDHEIEEALQLKEICFSKNEAYLALVMLLWNENGYCLQFVLFEKEVGVIKLMEQTHWLQKRCPGESVLLCGLESLRFATAQGKENFEVFVYAFSYAEDNPELLMTSLGPTTGGLHSLCKVEKLPNALMGMSDTMLYVWHLLETRLVTSVSFQPLDILPIERCIWAIIENGLMYFLTVCSDNSPNMGQLLAANLATGFCELATPYSAIPGTELTHFNKKNLKAAYSEPFLVVTCSEGGFLWSITDEYCCAALGEEAKMTAVTIIPQSDELYTIAVGNSEGVVNCYNVKYT